jgi:hypothetical protein
MSATAWPTEVHAPVDINAYFDKSACSRHEYRGQLSHSFQQALAERHAGLTEADCDFYHSVTLPDGRSITGEWDLRGSEPAYLGQYDLRNKRIIEYGPASGGLSRYMAAQAAELVVFDLAIGSGPEIVPYPDIDLTQHQLSGARSASRLRNSWWYVKTALGYNARAVYGDIYHQPDDLGRFDVSVFAAILLHLSNPFAALRQAASITTETMIVTDVLYPIHSDPASPKQSLMAFNPSPPPIGLIHWWAISPDVIIHMLRQLGFGTISSYQHTPTGMASRPPLFTVVAHRKG